MKVNKIMRLIHYAWFQIVCDHTLGLGGHGSLCMLAVMMYVCWLTLMEGQAGAAVIEIKGSCRKCSTWSTFTFKDIQIQTTHWKHLFFFGRVREPASWLSVGNVESDVWFGYVSTHITHESVFTVTHQSNASIVNAMMRT